MSKKNKKTKEKKLCCANCYHRGFSFEEPEYEHLKPMFRCGSCGNWWNAGHDGGEYGQQCQNPFEFEAWMEIKRRNYVE